MSPEAWFQVANTIALTGWLALALSPIAPRLLGLLGGIASPLLLSGGYTAIVLAHWASGQGGFDSLGAVAQLFENRWLLLAGWVHYLAFDLLLGAWQVRTARREGIAHLVLLPCLLATFLFGPAGYLLFQSLRAAHRVARSHPGDAAAIVWPISLPPTPCISCPSQRCSAPGSSAAGHGRRSIWPRWPSGYSFAYFSHETISNCIAAGPKRSAASALAAVW